MEKGARNIMVNAALKYEPLEFDAPKNPIFLPTPLKYGSVSIAQMVSNSHRYDASAYNIEAMNALRKVIRNKHGFVYLLGKDGLIDNAYYPGRYKRIYNENGTGEPFYLPSQLEEIYPKPAKYISPLTAMSLQNDRIKANTLLLSRSGTIGKCTISSKTTIDKLFSDDVIRVSFRDNTDLGYVYAFLNTETGLLILQSNNYGAVIDHIEPEHLANVPIPNAPQELKKAIHNLVVESYDLRDKSNDLIDEAQKLLYEELQLPDFTTIKGRNYAENKGFQNYVVKASQLNGRLDSSYHIPEVEEIIKAISINAVEVTTLGDPRISSDIILPGRFKRIYVDKEHGVPFFGGKQLLSLNPTNVKYLSLAHHSNRIEGQLLLEKNMCLITRSGTIGKVMIAPTHWEGWVANEHCLRLRPASENIAGYVYAWLDSIYAKPLIMRNIYGAVVDEIDDNQLSTVAIPLLKDKPVQQKINDLVLEANELRYQAYLKEQEAINKMNEILQV